MWGGEDYFIGAGEECKDRVWGGEEFDREKEEIDWGNLGWNFGYFDEIDMNT